MGAMSCDLTDLWDCGSTTGWAERAFSVVEATVDLGAIQLHTGAEVGWSLSGPAGPIDGIPVHPTPARSQLAPVPHPNGVTSVDHVVVLTGNMARTQAAFDAAGLELRRTRDAGHGRTQAFYWAGDTIIELVGPASGSDDGPATLWGIALNCEDLDRAASVMGPYLGSIRDAVQPGRRIATVRGAESAIGLAIALMTPHAER